VTDQRAPDVWKLEEEARLIGVSLRRLRDLIVLHAPPVIRNGNRVLFDEVAHQALKEAMRQPAAEKPPRAHFTSATGAAIPPSIFAKRNEEVAFERVLKRLAAPAKPSKPMRLRRSRRATTASV
jgi:hypothetical protein